MEILNTWKTNFETLLKPIVTSGQNYHFLQLDECEVNELTLE